MITRLIANLENVMSAVSVLQVGDLLIFENGQKALDLIKENIATFNASEITPLDIFTRGGTLAGNVMKKSTTSLSVEIKAMLLTDGSLILHRPEIKFFDLTVGKRTAKMRLENLPELKHGIFKVAFFDTKGLDPEALVSSRHNNEEPWRLTVPANANQLWVIRALQNFENDKLVSGSLTRLMRVKTEKDIDGWTS